MSGGHTHGPWTADDESGLVLKIVDGSNRGAIATVHGDHDRALISAAPDLLEACKAALIACESVPVSQPTRDRIDDAIEALTDAIRKAEGGAS